jgi:hypothetical protein
MSRPLQRQINRVNGTVTSLSCTRCGQLLAPGAFGPDPRNRVGLASWCNRCIVDKAKQNRPRGRPWAQQTPVSRVWGRRPPHGNRDRHYTGQFKTEIALGTLGNSCLACGSPEVVIARVLKLKTLVFNSAANLQVVCSDHRGEDHRTEEQRERLRWFC